MQAFLEQQARERKSTSTLENHARDLNDFLSAFPDIPFPELLEADEAQIAHYVDWLWTRDARRGSGHKDDRGNITFLSGSKLAPSVQPLSVVDNSDVSPNGLTEQETRRILASTKALHAS